MKTPPVSSTAKEFPIGSPVLRLRTLPLLRLIVPTMPCLLANQIRPSQSGSAEISESPLATTELRS